jgi:hypothetical protein
MVTAIASAGGTVGAVSTPSATRLCARSANAKVRPIPHRALILGAASAPRNAPTAATDIASPKAPAVRPRPR